MSDFLLHTCFSGSEDVYVWLRQFDFRAVSLGWSDQQRLYKACACFVDVAAAWLDTVQVSTWSDLKAALIHRFADSPELLANKLFSCAQSRFESVAEYADRLQSLAARMNQSNSHIPPCLLLRQFVQGLCPKLHSAVVLHHPADLADAIEFATYLEQYDTDSHIPSLQRQKRTEHSRYADFSAQQQDILPARKPRPYFHPPQARQYSKSTRPYTADAYNNERATRLQQLQHQIASVRMQLSEAHAKSTQAYTGEVMLYPESDADEASDADYDADYDAYQEWQDPIMPAVDPILRDDAYALSESEANVPSVCAPALISSNHTIHICAPSLALQSVLPQSLQNASSVISGEHTSCMTSLHIIEEKQSCLPATGVVLEEPTQEPSNTDNAPKEFPTIISAKVETEAPHAPGADSSPVLATIVADKSLSSAYIPSQPADIHLKVGDMPFAVINCKTSSHTVSASEPLQSKYTIDNMQSELPIPLIGTRPGMSHKHLTLALAPISKVSLLSLPLHSTQSHPLGHSIMHHANKLVFLKSDKNHDIQPWRDKYKQLSGRHD